MSPCLHKDQLGLKLLRQCIMTTATQLHLTLEVIWPCFLWSLVSLQDGWLCVGSWLWLFWHWVQMLYHTVKNVIPHYHSDVSVALQKQKTVPSGVALIVTSCQNWPGYRQGMLLNCKYCYGAWKPDYQQGVPMNYKYCLSYGAWKLDCQQGMRLNSTVTIAMRAWKLSEIDTTVL